MIQNQNTKLLALKNSKLETKFTTKFLISLSKIKVVDKNKNSVKSNSAQEIRKRSRRIKIAAYSSMAQTIGSRRVWSRALLFKLRNRARIHRFLRDRAVAKNKKTKGINKANMLRSLVPGGNKMDICGLLEETAHYIKCLSTQVKVMQSIVDYCSI